MRLKPYEIERLAIKLATVLKETHAIEPIVSDQAMINGLVMIITKELSLEDQINVEVEKMLAKYENQFESGQLDRQKMYHLIKNQIVKDKKVIL